MQSLLMLPVAFLVLTGLALLIKIVVRTNLGEGFFLAVSVIMLVLYAGGRAAGSFTPGFFLLIGLGGLGCILQVVLFLRTRTAGRKGGSVPCADDYSLPAVCILVFALLYGMILFKGAFLQNPDELHWYGPVLRTMAERNQLIDWSSFIIPYQPYAATFFELFFLKFAGSSEQVMYASAFLLNWIGFLLPMSAMKKRDWRKVVLYSTILFASLYSLYLRPYKSLYVDLPCIAWAGALAGWWIARDRTRKRTNLLVLAAGLVTLAFYKQMVGLLMGLLVLLFLFFEYEAEKCVSDRDHGKKRTLYVNGGTFLLFLTGAGVAGAGLLLLARGRFMGLLPESVRIMLEGSGFSVSKIVRLAGALGNAFLGTALHGKSDLKIYTFAFLVFLVIWQAADAWLGREKEGLRIRSWYMVLSSMGYMAALAISYITMFTYGEAAEAKSSKRYMSILVMFLFILCLSRWIQREEKAQSVKAIRLFSALALLLFFITGWNDRFIANATAFNEYQVARSEDIIETRQEAVRIGSLIGPEDRVFFINQKDGNEMPQNTAFCYLMDQVSNFILEPWRFIQGGCEIRETEESYPTVFELPILLEQGGYTYLWVYKTDDFLENSLQQVFVVNVAKDQMSDGQLFRVTYKDGHAVGLELAQNLKGQAALAG